MALNVSFYGPDVQNIGLNVFFYASFALFIQFLCFFFLYLTRIIGNILFLCYHFNNEAVMKQHYTLLLVHRNLELDNIHIDFYGSFAQACNTYSSLFFALVSSPYSRISLNRGGVELISTPLTCDFLER